MCLTECSFIHPKVHIPLGNRNLAKTVYISLLFLFKLMTGKHQVGEIQGDESWINGRRNLTFSKQEPRERKPCDIQEP